MHQCQEYIRQNYIVGSPNRQTVEATVLNAANANSLGSRLAGDAVSYFYSSVVTFADAMRGIREGFYCWSTVKLYYSVFYSIRSILASNSHCIFYVNQSPFSVTCFAGQCPVRVRGSTHQAVLAEFRRHFGSHPLLSQEIELLDPTDWLQEMRNEANYRHARFTEPEVPHHLESIAKHGVRRNLADYFNDDIDLYTFDPSHSIVAFPIKALRMAKAELCDQNSYDLSQRDMTYLSKLVRDQRGEIPLFSQFVCAN